MVFFWLLKTSEESEQTMSVIFGLSFISHVSVLLGAVRIGKVFRELWIIWFAPSNTWKVVITLIVNQDVILVSILSRMAQIFCGKSWILLGQSVRKKHKWRNYQRDHIQSWIQNMFCEKSFPSFETRCTLTFYIGREHWKSRILEIQSISTFSYS